ncbi:hypothetical protein [Streptosporangium sp. NPDC002607]
MPFKKGQYTVKEYDEAIQREQKWVKKCEEEGSPAAQHFKDSVEELTKARNKEKGRRP